MRTKLKREIEALSVDSFDTNSWPHASGTVAGAQLTYTCGYSCVVSWDYVPCARHEGTCDGSCAATCPATCRVSCGATCPVSCAGCLTGTCGQLSATGCGGDTGGGGTGGGTYPGGDTLMQDCGGATTV